MKKSIKIMVAMAGLALSFEALATTYFYNKSRTYAITVLPCAGGVGAKKFPKYEQILNSTGKKMITSAANKAGMNLVAVQAVAYMDRSEPVYLLDSKVTRAVLFKNTEEKWQYFTIPKTGDLAKVNITKLLNSGTTALTPTGITEGNKHAKDNAFILDVGMGGKITIQRMDVHGKYSNEFKGLPVLVLIN